jgi:DNA-binding NtrC family response regulator
MVVLLVEDNAALRTLAAISLKADHFCVLEARNGADALRVARSHSRIDLLLTDVEMGEGCDGIELASKLIAERPGLPVLVMSGLPESQGAAAQKGFPFMAKPFTTCHLRKRVGETLASKIQDRHA